MKVKARVWSTQEVVRPARIRWSDWHVFARPQKFLRVWHYAVYNSVGDVVLYDNTADYDKILTSALIRVEALRHMEIAGHKLKKYRAD